MVSVSNCDTSLPEGPRQHHFRPFFQKKNCFIHMKISQRFLIIKDRTKFWWLPWFPAKYRPPQTFLPPFFSNFFIFWHHWWYLLMKCCVTIVCPVDELSWNSRVINESMDLVCFKPFWQKIYTTLKPFCWHFLQLIL